MSSKKYKITPINNGFNHIDGIYFNGINSKIKEKDEDLGFIYSDEIMDVSAIFTTSKFKAAPLVHFLNYEKGFKTNFILLNSKNANAMTNKEGIDDINDILDYVSNKIKTINPIMSSTGVIGQRLDKQKIKSAIDKIDFKSRDFKNVATSITTTDKFIKTSSYKVQIENEFFTISAIAKGAGMINPSMATMLCFILTDAPIPKEDMDLLLLKANEKTFNAISVDGDTSTNDTVMLFSNHKAKTYDKDAFYMTLEMVMRDLSMDILKDAEGANKIVAFKITGAKDNSEAEVISKKISNSLLVKTALFGCDPNWGRIAATIGASGCSCDERTLSIYYDDVCVYKKGENIFDKDCEDRAFEVLKKDNFIIHCDIGLGDGEFTSYGCDLTYEYVKINAEYRT